MKTCLSWSGGKDSAWTLYQLKKQADIELTGVVVTINERYQRVAIHGTSQVLLKEQLKQIGLPYYPVLIPEQCNNETYQHAMRELINKAVAIEVEQMAFGDLFLEEVRAYREEQLAATPIRPLFPLWLQQDTLALVRQMIAAGLRAIVSCVDTKKLPAGFVGREFNQDFLNDLPKTVDPCGENGEFHTFVYDGPFFTKPIQVKSVGVHQVNEFVFADIRSVYEKRVSGGCA